MLALVWVICAAAAACNVALAASNVIKPSGKITISPSVVDLDSDVTFYTVSCQLEHLQEGLNSSSLYIETQNERIKSEIINTTTIQSKLDLSYLKHSEACFNKSFQCIYNDTALDSEEVYVGRPPATIQFQQNLKCFLLNFKEQYCKFTPVSNCDKEAHYSFHVRGVKSNAEANCKLQKANDTYFYSSKNNSCYFPTSDGVILRLEASNSIGNRTMKYLVDHDMVKPTELIGPTVVHSTSDSVAIKINEWKLKRVNRSIEFQFKLISKYHTLHHSTESKSSIFNYTIKDLNPFTEYELEMRLRVIPHSPRMYEEEYWSDWSERISFKTIARKPDRAPRTIPGAFSFKDHKGDRATVEVYWESMQEYQWNGPGFRYNVSAVTDTGQWYFPVINSRDSSPPYEVAIFEDIKLDHYWILVSCYNSEGSVTPNIIEVFPPKYDLKPKIKKVTNNRKSFNVSWYPPKIQQGISNYTLMYCNLTSSSSCKDSIRFVTIPSTNTSFNVTSSTVLNFAVSANYPTHSSDFSWQQCLVSSGADIGSPQFDMSNVTDTSFDIRMTTTCSSSSLYELLEVHVLTMNGTEIWLERFEQPEERISIGGLSADTQYIVKVVAFDELGNLHETSNNVQTEPKFTKLQLTLFFFCGMLLISALTMGTTRKVRTLSNIHVEMTVALQTLFGIDGDESKMMLKQDITDNFERTQMIYLDPPIKGYNNFSLVIPEEECDDESYHEDDPEEFPSAEEKAVQQFDKEDLMTLPEEPENQIMPIVPLNNGYVLAEQFMTPRESLAPQIPPNVTNGTTSGYVVFK